MDVKLFKEATVREAVLNAITHRSMIVQNDVVIKQSPNELTITNAGGFPIGVDKSNVLTVNSTPRSKRMAEVLQKTGLVEKSGQGVDKMFTNCIMEAKPLPDYSDTDNYQVCLKLRAEIRGKTESTVWKQLTDLKKKSLIEYRGSDKNGGYYAKEEMMIQG